MRKLMWFTVGFGAVCAFGAYRGSLWLPAIALGAAALTVISLFLIRFRRGFRVPAAVLLGIFAGSLMFCVYEGTILSPAQALDCQTQRMTVYIHGYSYETDYGWAVQGSVELDGRQYKVLVYLDSQCDLEPGNRLLGNFRFRYTSTGGIDEVLYHRGQGYFLIAYQTGNLTVERCWSTPLLDLPVCLREKLTRILEKCFPEDTVGFAKALLLGDRSDIDYETSTQFKVSGISHIIAVSGLHLSILFGFVYLVSGKGRFLTPLIGIPAALIFAAVVGFTPSVTRAAWMQILMILATTLKREYDGPTELAFSALVMLVWNPLVITSVSFQLSFACMAGIFLFSQPILNWLSHPERLGKPANGLERWFQSSVSVSVSATVLTTPLVAGYFGTVSLVAAVSNLLTLWAVTVAFYGILAVCALGWVSLAAGTGAAAMVAWPMRYILSVTKILAGFPLAAVYTKSVYTVAWLVLVYLLLGIFLCLKPRPVRLFSGLVLGSLCLALTLSWLEPLTGNGRMTVLDVGQGQAILLQSGGKTFLVDCGGDFDEDTADVTAETLLSQGIRRLDGIILTHYDRDHSGGLRYLLTRIRADVILVPNSADTGGVADSLAEISDGPVRVVYEDTEVTYGDTVLTLFAPESYNSGNESSMCVLFRTENCAILITGDRSGDREQLLLKYHDLPQVDALVVGHHGSRYATSEALLEAVRPEWAFISVGADNSYGHPAQSVLERLAQYGCAVYRTDENGTILFRW